MPEKSRLSYIGKAEKRAEEAFADFLMKKVSASRAFIKLISQIRRLSNKEQKEEYNRKQPGNG